MATHAKVKPAKRGQKAATRREKSSLQYVQQAIEDLDRAREQAGVEVRGQLDSAVERLRDAASEMRKRAEHEVERFEHAFEEAEEETRREYGRRVIMAQTSPEALSEMTAAVRTRRAQLAKARSGNGAR